MPSDDILSSYGALDAKVMWEPPTKSTNMHAFIHFVNKTYGLGIGKCHLKHFVK